MKNGRALRDLVTPIVSAPTVAEGLATTLRRVVDLTGATAGALTLRPRCQEPIIATAVTGRAPGGLRDWLTTVAATPAARPQLTRIAPPGAPRSGTSALLRTPLGAASRRVGELVLVGRVGSLTAASLPADLSQELTARHTIDDVFAAFAEGASQLVRFDSLSLLLLDAERREFEFVDVTARGFTARRPRDRWRSRIRSSEIPPIGGPIPTSIGTSC